MVNAIVIVLLATALIVCAAWLFLLKRDIRQLWQRLGAISETETNALVTTETFDKDITALSGSVNKALERSRRDVYERTRAEAALKRAITNISHDLRTPLTSALGYLQMLEAPGLDAETKTRYLAIVHGRLEALTLLMNNLFEYASVMEGNIKLDIKEVNVGNIMRDALSASYVDLENKGFTVEADIPDTALCICDEDALRRVLQNLIKNVGVHGKEYLRVRLAGGVIEIANKADGLADLDTASIFERFYTADASRTSQNTGLGLAIARELLTRMNGRITAEIEGGLLVMRVYLYNSIMAEV
ncbi:MAG: HAMP domain-containing histidine kinase [Lachnospiraceae bacterium]|jgi:signal transduction histidine kinase|nr:HAMP domain-containing histidine kinase [Lachnospiraceae bacterium]